LSLSDKPTSDFAKVIDQFVRQVQMGEQEGRPLRPNTDRLILVVGREASNSIKNHLRKILSRLSTIAVTHALMKVPQNADEKRGLSIVIKHIRRSWRIASERQATELQIRSLLALIQIQTLDVETGGADETTAKGILRQFILKDQAQAGAAWSKLVNECSAYAANHSGANRSMLQQVMLVAGFELQACRSYRDDISKLLARSNGIKSVLRDLSCLNVRGHSLKIHRQASELLRQSAQTESLLVIGDPGAGKSGALYDLAIGLEAEGHDVILLAADRIEAGSLGALRLEFGLNHEALEVLLAWPGIRRAYLILDGLDAARDPRREATFRDLIRELINKKSRWQVVASIRQFDLRHNHELQDLFRAARPLPLPSHLVSGEFTRMHHLCVPLLTDEELAQLASQSSDFDALFRTAPMEMRELLRVPFNLRLISALLTEGLSLSELTPIRTQSELLERYWEEKVIGVDGHGYDREGILRQTCECMVSARALRIPLALLNPTGIGGHLTHLLSSHVLTHYQPTAETPPDRSTVAYSHHVLFDYAVARLMLRHSPPTIVERLTQSPDLVLVIRPSLTLHFLYLWLYERTAFWELSLQLAGWERLSPLGKIIGPSVVAAEARQETDLDPLHNALISTNENTRKAAEHILRHIILSLAAKPETELKLAGLVAGPWSDLTERVSQTMRDSTAFSIRTLLLMICDHPELCSPVNLTAAGAAARHLLEYAWARITYRSELSSSGIQCVCRTFGTDPASSQVLLARALEEDHLKQYAYIEARWLADEVENLARIGPDFVTDIYRTLFRHQETSDARTPMSNSQILPLVSNRKQDFEHAQWILSEGFSKFLKAAPKQAAEALISVIDAYVTQQHPSYGERWQENSFMVRGHSATIREDFSHSWDSGDLYQDDNPIKMLNVFEDYILTADQEGNTVIINEFLDLLMQESRVAVWWRRLLLWGAKRPQTIGQTLKYLLKEPTLLVGMDTHAAAVEFLKAIFPSLIQNEREELERFILALPDRFSSERREFAVRKRDQLLIALTHTDLILPETVSIVASLRATQAQRKATHATAAVPSAESNTSATSHRHTELRQLVTDFEAAYKNSDRGPSTLSAMLTSLLTLRGAIQSVAEQDLPLVREAYTSLITGCKTIAGIDGLSCTEPLGSAVKQIL
ncbi:MAG: hypothetical protein ABI856_17005, partial [Nitrospira sp.]